ncbi:dymeclin isoform X2 [Iris pallida]|uniref:Dymeclin n=1 Tax=Iris pallida TaxID=29817 RepID=A0AAX6HZY2_IRIPA|nr:dymeclin isoform X2 [Iris pallida]
MGAVPSTPRRSERHWEAAENLIGALVGEKSFPISSELWKRILELPLNLQWPQDRITMACQNLVKNNYHTRHLAKILIHMVWCLQDCMSASSESSMIYTKAVNATFISSVFLKFAIENSKSVKFEELSLSLDEAEEGQDVIPSGQSVESFVMQGVLNFIGASEVSPHSCLLHHELLNFMLVAMSTQLCSGPSPGPKDVHPFIDATMLQEPALVASVVRRLLLNFVTRARIPYNVAAYPVYSDGNQPGVLQRVGSAAANFVLLPYYTFNYLVSSSADGFRSPLADNSLLVLLILIHYRKCIAMDEPIADNSLEEVDSVSYTKEKSYFHDNPYCKALENALDVEFNSVDIEGNTQNGPLVRLPYASLFDTLGLCLAEESSVLLLYSLVHGNSDFLEYVLVRTDLDTLLMPILETLYNASKRTSNQIYMLLIILLILSQDSSFNASIHKLIVLNVPWYQERLLHNTSLGSLMVVILIRTVKYNLSKLRDVYLHTNCLAILANMAPHVHRLSAYASQRLVSLFDMLSRKYDKLAELKNDKVIKATSESIDGESIAEEMSTELHIYTDFLRIVLEILNAILTYTLPQNPEVVYAIMHRQEVFQRFKSHPRFNELLENIFSVLDFFDSRMDMQRMDGEWSVDKVLQVIIINCRSWRGDGMKMFTQLRFTYEQENHPEEFFIPYVWRLVLTHSFTFNPDAINLLPMEYPIDVSIKQYIHVLASYYLLSNVIVVAWLWITKMAEQDTLYKVGQSL